MLHVAKKKKKTPSKYTMSLIATGFAPGSQQDL